MARTYDPITKRIIDLPEERMVGEPGSGAAAMEPKQQTLPAARTYDPITKQMVDLTDKKMVGEPGTGAAAMDAPPAAKQQTTYQPVRTDTTEHTISDVMARMANWDQIMGTDPHQAGLDQLESAILDRKPFEYDLDTDPAWQAYKKQYTREGRRASEDVMGQYAAMTGGMPSTAAMTAASQAGDYYAAQMADKIPELYKLAYSMYADDAARQLSDLNAIRGLSGDWYNRQNNVYGRLGDLYSLASGERSYADSRADLAYNRAWNEDERDRARAKEDEANTIYGYGSDGSSYKITSQLGRDFISNARYGDPDMTGGDGSIWHKNQDGTVTITRKDGRTYTVSGTPEEWDGLTLAQMWDAIDRANKTGTEIPPNVLKAWEHFMGGSYTGAPAASGGYGGGGYDLGGGDENPLAGFGLPAGKWREILGDAQGDKEKAMQNLTYYWDVLTDEQRGILAQHAGFQSADLDRLGGASKIGLNTLQSYQDFYKNPEAPYLKEDAKTENDTKAGDTLMSESEWKKNKMGYQTYDDYLKDFMEWLNS